MVAILDNLKIYQIALEKSRDFLKKSIFRDFCKSAIFCLTLIIHLHILNWATYFSSPITYLPSILVLFELPGNA
jgi:hypothetical protein